MSGGISSLGGAVDSPFRRLSRSLRCMSSWVVARGRSAAPAAASTSARPPPPAPPPPAPRAVPPPPPPPPPAPPPPPLPVEHVEEDVRGDELFAVGVRQL